MVWETIGASIVAGLGRSVFGWAENSFKDGNVSGYEWGMLASTILQVGVIAVATSLSLGTGAVESAAIGTLSSFVLSALKR